MEAETSRAGKSRAAGSLTLGEGEEKFAAASSTESRDGQAGLLGILGGSRTGTGKQGMWVRAGSSSRQ